MAYICTTCNVLWPCAIADHNQYWSNKVWMRDDAEVSIPCWMLDHDECQVAMFCICLCHKHSDLEESPIAAPPTNR